MAVVKRCKVCDRVFYHKNKEKTCRHCIPKQSTVIGDSKRDAMVKRLPGSYGSNQ